MPQGQHSLDRALSRLHSKVILDCVKLTMETNQRYHKVTVYENSYHMVNPGGDSAKGYSLQAIELLWLRKTPGYSLTLHILGRLWRLQVQGKAVESQPYRYKRVTKCESVTIFDDLYRIHSGNSPNFPNYVWTYKDGKSWPFEPQDGVGKSPGASFPSPSLPFSHWLGRKLWSSTGTREKPGAFELPCASSVCWYTGFISGLERLMQEDSELVWATQWVLSSQKNNDLCWRMWV